MPVPEATFNDSSANIYTAPEWAQLQNATSEVLEYQKVSFLSTPFLIFKFFSDSNKNLLTFDLFKKARSFFEAPP